jgi:hypothetical protein
MSGKILVIENNTRFFDGITRVLDELGFESYVHIIGVEQKQPVHGLLKAFDPDGDRIDIKLAEYLVALVDGVLFGHVHVWQLIPELKAVGVECVGISNVFYDLLKRSGATVSPERQQVFAYLRKDLPAIYAAARARSQA